MILVIGGHAQGALEYAAGKYGNERVSFDDLNSFIRAAMENGEDPWRKLEEALSKDPEAVVVSELIGCGIVPIDPKEREFRETVGRIQIALAERADEVIRVICGIGQKIK